MKAVFFFFFFFFLPSSVSRIIRESESKCSRLTFFFVFIFLVSFPSAYHTGTCSYRSSSISSLISSSFSVSRLLYYLLASSSTFYSNSPFVLSPLQLLYSNFSFYSHFPSVSLNSFLLQIRLYPFFYSKGFKKPTQVITIYQVCLQRRCCVQTGSEFSLASSSDGGLGWHSG